MSVSPEDFHRAQLVVDSQAIFVKKIDGNNTAQVRQHLDSVSVRGIFDQVLLGSLLVPGVNLLHSFIHSSNISTYSVPNPVLGTGITKLSKIQASYILVGQR